MVSKMAFGDNVVTTICGIFQLLDDTVEPAKYTKNTDGEVYSNVYDDHLNLYAVPDTAQYYETVSLVWPSMYVHYFQSHSNSLCSLYLKEWKPVEDMSLLRFD